MHSSKHSQARASCSSASGSLSPYWPWVGCFVCGRMRLLFGSYLDPGAIDGLCFHAGVDAKPGLKLRIGIPERKIQDPEVSTNLHRP